MPIRCRSSSGTIALAEWLRRVPAKYMGFSGPALPSPAPPPPTLLPTLQPGTVSFLPCKYSVWEIRACVLISLTLQILLIFLAPLRKNKAIKPVRFITWSCYLLADWIADFALGLLLQSNSLGNESPQATSTSISLGTIDSSTTLKHGPANNTNTATTANTGLLGSFPSPAPQRPRHHHCLCPRGQ